MPVRDQSALQFIISCHADRVFLLRWLVIADGNLLEPWQGLEKTDNDYLLLRYS